MPKPDTITYKAALKLFVIPLHVRPDWKNSELTYAQWARRFLSWKEARDFWPDVTLKKIRIYTWAFVRKSEMRDRILAAKWEARLEQIGTYLEMFCIDPYTEAERAPWYEAKIESEEDAVEFIASHLELIDHSAISFAKMAVKHSRLQSALLVDML